MGLEMKTTNSSIMENLPLSFGLATILPPKKTKISFLDSLQQSLKKFFSPEPKNS
jgi:hypothetical protein